jgi:hypothetical protein
METNCKMVKEKRCPTCGVGYIEWAYGFSVWKLARMVLTLLDGQLPPNYVTLARMVAEATESVFGSSDEAIEFTKELIRLKADRRDGGHC